MAEGLHPLEAAQHELDVCTPALTGDPTTDTTAMVEASDAAKRLEGLSDEQLLSKAVRQSLITLSVLLEATRRHGARLLATNPAGLGVLIDGLVACLTAANEPGCGLLELQRQATAEAKADRRWREDDRHVLRRPS